MMKLDEDFLDSMKEAFERFRSNDSASAADIVKRAMRGEQIHTNPTAKRSCVPDLAALTDFYNASARAPYKAPVPDAEDRGHFSARRYSNAAGQRNYKLYVPSIYATEPLPLVVMLHGCTQDANDFAAGTQMNALAERHGFIVVYPVQPQSANPSKCWNWFKPSDQQRESGEPSLIAGVTREVMDTHNVDPARVYIAGLSAGGAMAAIMAQCYSDLYAAAGVHSGLPVGCAHDLPSALAAMRGGQSKTIAPSAALCPLIVFHGDADATVSYSCAQKLIDGFHASGPGRKGTSNLKNARQYTVNQLKSRDGLNAELWTIHGAPHAWSGGSTLGSYTDPSGPEASAEMARFFLANPKR